MTISIWRYSHLVLAISSFIFIALASITGVVLAIEPVSNQLKPYATENTKQITLAETITALEQHYDEVIAINIDSNHFISASVITTNGSNETFYINAKTGEKLGEIIERSPVFRFATNLHRSLFLKSTGRLIIGIISLILLLMVITGIILIIKRQGGIKRFFSKTIKENFEQYYHIIIGKYTLIPIIIITITGMYLSLEKFSLLPNQKITHTINDVSLSSSTKVNTANFDVFKTITLNTVKSVEFPFSKDIEDYFIIKLLDRELLVNQYTGQIASEQNDSLIAIISRWSLALHTGQGSILWSIILLITCIAILFFIYSGFAMTLKRKKKSPLPKNRYAKDDAEFIILVGSETGSTYNFATVFYNALIAKEKTAYISELNNYTTYKKAKRLIVFTATYGDGEAPTNAKHFEKLLHNTAIENTLNYSVIGFGSLLYPEYCKYALMVDAMLQLHPNFIPNCPLYKVDNQSFEAFKEWTNQWSKSVGLKLDITSIDNDNIRKNEKTFIVKKKTTLNVDHSFLIELKPLKRTRFTSGDLLAIYPNNDTVKRLYSIGKIENSILLSIKKHDLGKCSNMFYQLKTNDMITATIERNPHFYIPKKAKEVIMIANGTGIAPFLGMINNNKKLIKTHLFWGGRTQESFGMYSELVDNAFANKTLSGIHVAYSRAYEKKIYVQDLLLEQKDFIGQALQNGSIIMLCGSVAMQNAVLDVLEQITTTQLNCPLSTFEDLGQIKMDCY